MTSTYQINPNHTLILILIRKGGWVARNNMREKVSGSEELNMVVVCWRGLANTGCCMPLNKNNTHACMGLYCLYSNLGVLRRELISFHNFQVEHNNSDKLAQKHNIYVHICERALINWQGQGETLQRGRSALLHVKFCWQQLHLLLQY